MVMLVLLIAMIAINHQVNESLQIKERLTKHFHLKELSIGKESDLIYDSFVVIIILLIVGVTSIVGTTSKM